MLLVGFTIAAKLNYSPSLEDAQMGEVGGRPIPLYLLSFGTERGEQMYTKVALVLLFIIWYTLGEIESLSGPADAKTRAIPIIALSTLWLGHFLTELYRLTLVFF